MFIMITQVVRLTALHLVVVASVLYVGPATPQEHPPTRTNDQNVSLRQVSVVPLSAATEEACLELAEAQVHLLLTLQEQNGRIPYMIDGNGNEVPNRRNAIRLWLATLALAEYGQAFERDDVLDAAERHGDHLLDLMLVQFEGKPALRLRDRIKLGTHAIAGMALLVLEQAGRPSDRLAADDMLASVLSMQEPDGEFRTFLDPPDRNDQQLFYPGEALTFMALYLPHLEEPARTDVLAKCLHGIQHYHHRWDTGELENPAFAPWHLQAISLVSHHHPLPTHTIDYADELARYLAENQQLDDAPSSLDYGHFFDPERPELGRSHASSTAVYLEGLGAYEAMHRPSGDGMTSTSATIYAGFRSLVQLSHAS
ncbi:MAG: hypothetical protein AAFS11_02175, partial [Planctomycetota bacterium]